MNTKRTKGRKRRFGVLMALALGALCAAGCAGVQRGGLSACPVDSAPLTAAGIGFDTEGRAVHRAWCKYCGRVWYFQAGH